MELTVEFAPVADARGIISDRSPQTPPISIRVSEARVRTRTGCALRPHVGQARFSGGVTYDSGPRDLIDCEELVVPLDLVIPPFQETALEFEIDGFDVGESVEVIGTLVYQPIFSFREMGISVEDARRLPGLSKDAFRGPGISLQDDAGARINICKSLIYRWFGLFDIRARPMGKEISDLLTDDMFVQFPDDVIRNKAQFVQWYDRQFPQVKAGYHEIETVRVTLDGASTARVELTPLLHAELATGQRLQMGYRIQAELVEVDSLAPKIKTYTAIPIAGQ